jgi:hypothetical protein
MLRSSLRRTARLAANGSPRIANRAARRFASSESHGSAKHGSDLPWLIPSVGITVPLVHSPHFPSVVFVFGCLGWGD